MSSKSTVLFWLVMYCSCNLNLLFFVFINQVGEKSRKRTHDTTEESEKKPKKEYKLRKHWFYHISSVLLWLNLFWGIESFGTVCPFDLHQYPVILNCFYETWLLSVIWQFIGIIHLNSWNTSHFVWTSSLLMIGWFNKLSLW